MKKSLQGLKTNNLYRELVVSDVVDSMTVRRGDKKYISFASNDYFGLSQNAEVKKAAIMAIKKFGIGAAASRYVTGNNSLYTKLEKQIAQMKKAKDAIVFSSGYATAIGVLPALVGEGDLIVADKLIHSSLLDGAKLSGAKLIRFLHNDLAHAQRILAENRAKFKKCLIITETVFSMDGDVSDVGGLWKLAREFKCDLLTDDAHGLWQQITSSLALQEVENIMNLTLEILPHEILEADGFKDDEYRSYIQIGTLSKAVGTLGGYVASDKITIDYLRNFAKSQIYSTALPPSVLAASLASLKIIAKKNLAKKALENANYFCELMNLPRVESAIVVIIIGDNKKVLEIAKLVLEKGFIISAIRPPTVEAGKSRLRITFSSEHKKSDIKKLIDNLLIILGREADDLVQKKLRV